MNGREIDGILNRASSQAPQTDPALLDRISGSLGSPLRPVRPLPPNRVLVTALVAVCAAVALAGASFLGLDGIRKMDAAEAVPIFATLAALALLSAAVAVTEMIPGSRRTAAAWAPVVIAAVALAGVFGLVFHDYRVERFVPQGLTCLKAGMLHAVPAALGSWWLLHRGFPINSVGAGLAQGTLAGLAGAAMLELHCSNFEAPHVMVWHTAVVPVSGAAGALVGWIAQRRRTT